MAERLGFEVPTLVQAEAIPVILSGKHVYSSVTWIFLGFSMEWCLDG